MASLLLLAAGGTIAGRSSTDGVRTVLDGRALLARAGIGEGEGDVGVGVEDVARGPSWSLGIDDAAAIARAAVDAATSGRHRGVVVTHGTDTVEETAFLTWLLGGAAASERCPIVFTAAMRHDEHPDADGPANLRGALELAAGGGLPGPVLHMGGRTHHARWVTKTDTTALDALRSAGGEGTPPAPPPHGGAVEARVAQVPSHAGVDPGIVAWHLERGVRGLVVEGTGAGNVNGALVDGIAAAVDAGVPVVVTSRCWTGRVSPTYGGPGGGHQLADLGCIPGGDLPTHKARVALSVALGVDPAPAAVRAWFAELVGS